MSAAHEIKEEEMEDGEVLLTWTKGDAAHYPLNFWYVPKSDLERAKGVILTGEMDTDEPSPPTL